MTRLDELREALEPCGFTVDTWSPGDGVTRYRFFRVDHSKRLDGRRVDYFEESGIHTALGLQEAQVFAKGLTLGAGGSD